VRENIFLGRERRTCGVLLDRRTMREMTKALLAELRTAIDPEEKIRNLSVADKQMVEIAKAVVNQSRLMIMDEPTTVLTKAEIGILFALMRRLQAGGTAIIYISHKLREVKEICDEVMVLRDGRFISLDRADSIDEHEMARRMVGREVSQMFPAKTIPGRDVALDIKRLSAAGLVRDVSFRLHKGEILGLSGLVGAGRTEAAEAIMGIRKREQGEIAVNGRAVRIRSPRDAVRHRIAYLSEDRQGSGILTDFSVTRNVTLVSLRKYGRLITNRRREAERATHYARAFNIKAASLDTRLQFLSGGNQQKVALAKGLDPDPAVFIFDEPTRGIDVNAKREIYAFIHKLVQTGIACILISSDLEEIVGLCHRVAVMREGRIAGFVEGERINEQDIMLLATGVGQRG
jgi:ribose transport system ATP-binding protein